MTDTDWLQSLKADDMVLIPSGWNGRSHIEAHVTRTTPTQIVIANGSKYRKEDGRPFGNHYGNALVQPTPELLAEIADEEARDDAIRTIAKHRGSRWDGVSTSTLQDIAEILIGGVSAGQIECIERHCDWSGPGHEAHCPACDGICREVEPTKEKGESE